MANHSTNQSGFMSHMTYRAGTRELSESMYNLVIGGCLTWGFLVNYLLMQFAAPTLIQMIYNSTVSYSTVMIGIIVAYFVLVMIGNSMVRSFSPLTCFIGYNLIAVPVGLLASVALIGYDPALVTRAVLITAVITLAMMLVSTIFPAAFSRLGSGLSIALLAVILVEGLAALFFRADITVLDWVVVGIMALYIGFDWVRANSVQRTSTNAIAAASALYLDIINILLRVLRILARSRSND